VYFLFFFCLWIYYSHFYQFALFNSILRTFFFTWPTPRSYFTWPKLLHYSLLILLCGEVVLNPGPFDVCTLNSMFLTNITQYTALLCIAEAHHIDLLALTETWITPSTTSAEHLESEPTGFFSPQFSSSCLSMLQKINTYTVGHKKHIKTVIYYNFRKTQPI
jgi:hypothetical protein